MEKRIYTAESVTSGHPDKLADLIADSILDVCLEQEYTEDSPRFHRPPLDEISRTLKAGLHDAGVQISEGSFVKIRKLTPTECLRLMGWKDSIIDKIRQAKLSSTQMYKQAGNGIVVDVLMAIFKNLFIELGE